MSDKEIKDEATKAQEAHETPVKETTAEAPPVEAPPEETKEIPKTPEPTATGNEEIEILKHDIYRKDTKKASGDTTETISIRLTAKNISSIALGSVMFEAELYDINGNVLDKVEEKVMDFKPDSSRAVSITYSKSECDKVRSYCVKAAKTAIAPKPKMTGNEKVKIIKHSIIGEKGDDAKTGVSFEGDFNLQSAGIDAAIRNISDVTISTLAFEATLYDIEGNVLDTIRHEETDLKPNNSRAIMIRKQTNPLIKEREWFTSYDAKIVRMTTADYEKVQIRRHEIIRNGDSMEVKGVVKNLSTAKTDAALVAIFLNLNDENIGVRVMLIKDIEPNKIKQFVFNFKPMEGDKVKTCNINIGEIVE